MQRAGRNWRTPGAMRTTAGTGSRPGPVTTTRWSLTAATRGAPRTQPDPDHGGVGLQGAGRGAGVTGAKVATSGPAEGRGRRHPRRR